MTSFRQWNEMSASEILLEFFDDNFSDVPSEDDIVNENCEENFNDSEFITPVVKNEVAVLSSDTDTDDEDDSAHMNDLFCSNDTNCWSEIDIPPGLEMFEGHSGVITLPSQRDSVASVTSVMFGDDLFEMFCKELNTYHEQTSGKRKTSSKTLKWSTVTQQDMKKFLGLILLMGQTRKDSWKDYWSTDPLIVTPIFSQTMSRNRFEQIWTFWHFNDNSKMDNSSGRLFKIQPVLDYLLNKFRTVYRPKQELSLHEGMVPWRGSLRFRSYNPAKITKHGLLVRMVCESDTCYICNMEIYTGEGKKLEETVLSALSPYLGVWHHVYQDIYYNSTSTADLLLKNKTRVCGTIRSNKGLPPSLKVEAEQMKKGDTVFCRNGDVLLLVYKGKQDVRMISTIHDTSMSNTGKKNRKTKEYIVKPVCVNQYNANIKGVDRVNQYLSYCPLLRKTMKWTKKIVLYLINCGLFNCYRIYLALNPEKKMKYKQFLLSVARYWITDNDNEVLSEPTRDTPSPSPCGTGRAPRKDPPGRLSGDMKQHQPVYILGKGKKKFPTRACKVCTAHGKRSETRYQCKFCMVPLHRAKCFTQYHTVKKY